MEREENIQRRLRSHKYKPQSNFSGDENEPECSSSPDTYEDHSKNIHKQNESGKSRSYCLFYIIFGLFGVAMVVIFIFQHIKSEQNPWRKVCSFDDLQSRHPKQSKLWKSLKVNIESILNNEPPKPSVYLLLHKNSSADQKLIDAIAAKASSCFDQSLRPIRINFDSSSSTEDYGHIIEEFRKKVRGGGTVLITNLNHISGKTARALHSICDIESPVIRKVLILLTLTSFKDSGRPTEDAEDILNELWKPDLNNYELDPLIARVTDQVFQFNFN